MKTLIVQISKHAPYDSNFYDPFSRFTPIHSNKKKKRSLKLLDDFLKHGRNDCKDIWKFKRERRASVDRELIYRSNSKLSARDFGKNCFVSWAERMQTHRRVFPWNGGRIWTCKGNELGTVLFFFEAFFFYWNQLKTTRWSFHIYEEQILRWKRKLIGDSQKKIIFWSILAEYPRWCLKARF